MQFFLAWAVKNGNMWIIFSNEKRPLSIEKVEREIAKARSLIVDREFRNGKASRKEKEARVLSRAAERTEQERIDNFETDLTMKGWSISTLIHDEIIIQRPIDEKMHLDFIDALSRDAKLVLRNFENTKGWAPGTLDVNVCSYWKCLFQNLLLRARPIFVLCTAHFHFFVFSGFCLLVFLRMHLNFLYSRRSNW